MTGQQNCAGGHRGRIANSEFLQGGLISGLRLVLKRDNLRHLPRLLREGISPLIRLAIQAHNTAEITRSLRDGRQLDFVSSFPRSGNTWVRHLLADVFLQNHGLQTDTKLPVHPDRILPDFYCDWIARRDVRIPVPAILIKTHETFPQLQKRFAGVRTRASGGLGESMPAFPFCKHVYLYRAPEDALVSLYHYFQDQKHLRRKAAAGIDGFCLANLAMWEENLASYLRAADEGYPVWFVPYDLLLQYPSEILSQLLRWLGTRHDGATVERAISNMEFSKLQALEVRGSFQEEAVFFRRGCKGSGRAELEPATMDIILQRTSGLLERANTRVLDQQARKGTAAASKTAEIHRNAAFQNKQSNRLPTVSSLQNGQAPRATFGPARTPPTALPTAQ